jgi:hypothetical protein
LAGWLENCFSAHWMIRDCCWPHLLTTVRERAVPHVALALQNAWERCGPVLMCAVHLT